jgi:hypothetical protein
MAALTPYLNFPLLVDDKGRRVGNHVRGKTGFGDTNLEAEDKYLQNSGHKRGYS